MTKNGRKQPAARPTALRRRSPARPRATKPAAVSLGSGAQRHSLVEQLQGLGFSEYEARAYIALLQSSPATAYEVSKAAGLPRANTYSALEICTQKGAVQPFSQNPTRYVPVDPQNLLARIARDTSSRCQQLASDLSHLKAREERDFVWNLQGADAVNAMIAEMIANARVHVWIKAHEDVVETHRTALRDATERGVTIMIILFGQDEARFRFNDNVRIYLHEGNGVRVGNADNLFTITTDFKTALTAKMHGEVYAAYTRSEPIVTMAESLIRHDLYLAEIFQRFGTQIDEAFGPFLASLRRSYFSPEQVACLEQTLVGLGAAAELKPKASSKGTTPTTTRRDSAATRTA